MWIAASAAPADHTRSGKPSTVTCSRPNPRRASRYRRNASLDLAPPATTHLPLDSDDGLHTTSTASTSDEAAAADARDVERFPHTAQCGPLLAEQRDPTWPAADVGDTPHRVFGC